MTRPLYISLGLASLVLGVIGIFLPLLPTTPFIILAAFFFSKSSKKLHRWLRQHSVFGGPLRDWENNKVIKTKYKIIATVMVAAGLIYPIFFLSLATHVKAIAVGSVLIVFTYLWSRPSKSLSITNQKK